MKPYYESGGISIFHADSREIVNELPDFDLLLADPPYGIGEAAGANASRSVLAKAKDYGNDAWDTETIDEKHFSDVRRKCKWQIIFGGNYYQLPPSPCWLVWDKENGANDFADCELAWTNLKKAVRMIRHRWNGMLRKDNEPRWHPTQKPEHVMGWAIRQAPDDVKTILDPWMGSGTTLLAARDNGKTAVGIEREEKYCEIAAMRLQQQVLFNAGDTAIRTTQVALQL